MSYILVEGVIDRLALEAVAARLGLDLGGALEPHEIPLPLVGVLGHA